MIKGRITKGVGGLYTVSTPCGIYECGIRGIFRKRKIIPAIGDFVTIEIGDEQNRRGVITEIAERKNLLARPRISNIDQAVLVFSIINPVLNTDLLDRFLLTTESKGIDSVICFTKIDLTNLIDEAREKELRALCAMYNKIGYTVLCVSTVTGEGIEQLPRTLEGKVSVFAGPSGVGKSSVINAILPGARMETGELSLKIMRGKHTTRHTELLELTENSFIADSPGFTTLAIEHLAQAELPRLFREFRPFLGRCKFGDCTHLHEPDCIVRQQVGTSIDPIRYMRYKQFMTILTK